MTTSSGAAPSAGRATPLGYARAAGGVRVFPLGGLGEVGMNCLAIEQDGVVVLVDCGVTFDRRGLGVDVVHPDFSALEAFRGRIAGVFVTHGHEDHIGALPYLLRAHDVPVWAPRYSLGLLRARADEHEVLAHARLVEVRPRERVQVGPFSIEPVRVTHSTADSTALAIETSAGRIVHTGDFKFDEAPPDGEVSDVERLRELGDQGVALLCSDSTNIDTPAATGSEAGVGDALERLVGEATGRVVIGLFASNVHRLHLLGGIARRTGRKLVALGRSVRTHARVAAETGYLPWPLDDLVPPEVAAGLPRNRVLGVATGTQAEGNAALARIARGDHVLSLEAGDTVLFSSRVIPGHEAEVFALTNDLLRRGLRVITRLDEPAAHVSGHAARPEQARMIALTRPASFLPLHGTLHHLTRHAALAASLGVPRTLMLEDGEVGELAGGSFTKVGRVPSGRVHVAFGRAIPPEVIRERIHLATGGLVVAAIRVDGTGHPLGAVRLVSRGVLGGGASSSAAAEAEREVRVAIADLSSAARADDSAVANAARTAIRRAIARVTGYKPEVEVVLVRVAEPRLVV